MVDHAAPGLVRERIRHVVVPTMENRSFDDLLGHLQHDDPANPNLDRLKPSCPVGPSRPDGKRAATRASASPVLGNDPDHSHQAVMLQIFGRTGTPGVGTPSMTGFVESYRHKVTAGTLKSLAWWEGLTDAVTTTPEVAAERALNDFRASLIELARAVRTARSGVATGLRVGAAEDSQIPSFTPGPSCHEVVETGALQPGSAAGCVVADVVADFTREGRVPDPAPVEFGNGPTLKEPT